LKNHKYEIILIDDGNTAAERENLTRLTLKYPTVRLFSLQENLGQHYATHFACQYATGTFVCSMDDDGQHNPKDIDTMLEVLKKRNYDIVYAQFIRNFETPWRSVVRKLIYWWNSVLRKSNKQKSSLRIWTGQFNEELISLANTNKLFDQKCLALKPIIGYVTLAQRPSSILKSRYSLKHYIRYFIQMIS
jgi:glycosyltransferase involved in cell wall biosynthesis